MLGVCVDLGFEPRCLCGQCIPQSYNGECPRTVTYYQQLTDPGTYSIAGEPTPDTAYRYTFAVGGVVKFTRFLELTSMLLDIIPELSAAAGGDISIGILKSQGPLPDLPYRTALPGRHLTPMRSGTGTTSSHMLHRS